MYRRLASQTLVTVLLAGALFLAGPRRAHSQPAGDPLAEAGATAAPASADQSPDKKVNDPEGILGLDIEQLSKVDVVAPSLNMEVSTVERTESTVGRTPAAVFVITNEMIRRSGVRTVPDALRLAPGVEVAQKTANQWAITIRGFNSVYADKLLVQIDGRSVYNPIFGGVYWDVQDLVLEDIERIEVVRGPGGTIWGANAVNGVINIITKSSKDTQGGFFQGATGTEERAMATARYGGQLGDNATYRVYSKWFEVGPSFDPNQPAADDWRQARTGFRMDWDPDHADKMTLQGDYYNGQTGQEGTIPSPSPPFYQSYRQDEHVSGGNVLGRWTHTLENDSDWSLQWYYDDAERHGQVLPLVLDYQTFDLDFQYHFLLGENHSIICGAGYRNYNIQTRPIPFCLEFTPNDQTDDLYSCFIQDQMTLRPDLLYFILGTKFEENSYTGFEMQPTARLLWTPDKKNCLWASVSRAVQTPTLLTENSLLTQRNGELPNHWPIFTLLSGSSNMQAADVIAYEAGMRQQPTKRFYWDLALFYNDYRKLLGGIAETPYYGLTPTGWPAAFLPGDAIAGIPAQTYGFELASGYELTKRWNLRAAYSFLRGRVEEVPGVIPGVDWDSPRNQFYLWLAGDLGQHWFLDLIGRYAEQDTPYFVGDVRLAWRPTPNVEWAVVGRNLFMGNHMECGGHDVYGVLGNEVQEEVFTTVSYRF